MVQCIILWFKYLTNDINCIKIDTNSIKNDTKWNDKK